MVSYNITAQKQQNKSGAFLSSRLNMIFYLRVISQDIWIAPLACPVWRLVYCRPTRAEHLDRLLDWCRPISARKQHWAEWATGPK